MNTEERCHGARTRLIEWIESEASFQKRVIGNRFAMLRFELEQPCPPAETWVRKGLSGSWATSVTLARNSAEFVAPGGKTLYRSDPLYINVPEILAIWLRSTTLFRVARRIWVGENAE